MAISDNSLYDAQGRPVVRLHVDDAGAGGGGGTSDAAVIGAINETAPATDTATSALNGRLQRVAQRLTSLIGLLPTSLGAKAAASSLAVTLATDDVLLTRQGALTETAPATDTASSGINGRLQRVAQRISALIALLPTGLGQGTMAQSLKVVVASDQSALKMDHTTTGIGHGVRTVGTPGTAVALVAVSTPAKWVMVQAQTDNTGGIAVGGSGVLATVATGTGLYLAAGDSLPLAVDNLADVFIDATVATDGVRFIYGS
jgi:hypothetical protein